jgi:hypothetical protein
VTNEYEIGFDPHGTAAVGRLHYLHLYATEVLGRTPALPLDRVLHQAPRCVPLPLPKIELRLKVLSSNP